MTARDTYTASVKAAASVQAASLVANEGAKQTTIDASKSVVGYTLQTGNMANLQASVTAANKAKFAADFAAEQTKQAAIAAARETLRATGDLAPV
jgi:hypothetical protein